MRLNVSTKPSVRSITRSRLIYYLIIIVVGSLENGNTPKRAVRSTANDNERHEYNVEKIVGKRFNTRKHLWEYEVKWENYEK